MAVGATMHTFSVQLADVDRGVYDDIGLRVARHPSETAAFMMTRVLAYCLEFEEGIAFSEGVSSTDEPAVLVRDLTGGSPPGSKWALRTPTDCTTAASSQTAPPSTPIAIPRR